MAQNAFYVLETDSSPSAQSSEQPQSQNHQHQKSPSFGFATHPLNDLHPTRSTLHRPKSFIPLYFDSEAAVGGLLCGLQENTKILLLTNILHSSLASTDARPSSDVICFTAQNGSRNIVSAVASLPEPVSRDTQIIILTPPCNVSKMRDIHRGSPRTTVYPLLVHEDGVQYEHVLHLAAGDPLDPSAPPVPGNFYNPRTESTFKYSDLLNGPGLAEIKGRVDLREYTPSARNQKVPPPHEWVTWLKEGQKPSSSRTSSNTSSETTSHASRLILCIDWSGLFPQEHRTINVLGDIALTSWLKYCQAKGRSGTSRTVVVCDQAHDYLYNISPGPFTRKLLQLASSSLSLPQPVSPEPSGGVTLETAASLILLSESPIGLPRDLLDHFSYLIIHRFTAPSWLKSLEEHFFLPSTRESTTLHDASQEAPKNSSHAMSQIVEMGENEVMLFAPGKSKMTKSESNAPTLIGTVQTNSTKSKSNKKGFGHQWIKIRLSNGQDTPASTPRDSGFNGFTSSTTSSGSMSSNQDPIHDANTNALRRDPGQNPNSFNLMPPKSSRAAYTSQSHAPYTPIAHTSPRTWGLGALTSTPGSGINSNHVASSTTGSLLSPTIDGAMRTPLIPSPGVIAPPTRLSPPSPEPRSLSTGSGSGSMPYLSPSSPVAGGVGVGVAGSGFSPFTAHRTFRHDGGGDSSLSLSSQNHIPAPLGLRFETFGHSGGGGGHAGMNIGVSSPGYVEVRPMGDNTLTNSVVVGPGNPSAGISGTQNLSGSVDGGIFGFAKPTYRDVMAKESDTSLQRRDTVVPERYLFRPGAGAPSSQVRDRQTGALGPSGGTSATSVSESDTSPPSPPTYPESFFWPLLDALERARAQVSTPHNRAQSVRHSVVGQELPQAARQRLQLTFKEYVAAAARAGVIVTGDAGDKAWIALKEWKYPGKNTSSHTVRMPLK